MSSSSSTRERRLLTLKASDGETFPIDEAAAVAKFGFVKQLVDDGCAGGVIVVPHADSQSMVRMLEWCKRHTDRVSTRAELKAWDAEFVKDMDPAFIYKLILAADYLSATELLDLLAQKTADMIKGKKVEEIREIFHIENDFAPGQEAEIRAKNPWAFS